MVNEQAEPRSEEPATERVVPDPPVHLKPLVILATDDAAVCVDDLCLPPDVER
jgi:hypothetical protein